MEIHDKIRKFRIDQNFSQQYMAEELGIDVSNYGRMESGKAKICVGRIQKIAEILGVNIVQFFETEDYKNTIENTINENKQNIEKLLLEFENLKTTINKLIL